MNLDDGMDAGSLDPDRFASHEWADERGFYSDADPAYSPPEPDALGLILEVDTMVAVFTAQRFVRIDEMRREAIAQATAGSAAEANWMPQIAERSLRLELASALRVSEFAAEVMITQAEALVHRYPSVLASLAGARITETHARVLVEAVDTVEPQLREGIVPRAVALAEELPVASFRRALRALIDTVRSVTLAERHEEALKARRVVVEPADDGMAWLSAFMPAVEAHAIHNRITAIAKVLGAADDETRTLDQLRSDVVGDLLVQGETDAHPGETRGIRATVAVTVPALRLLESDLGAGAEGFGVDCDPNGDLDVERILRREPARVEGVGPIPWRRARELCGGAEGWMRILTHPETGAVLSVGREQYRPPPSLRRLVRWRADRCMAPGCGIPAARCEIDHTVAWEHGGSTSLDNLAPLCKGHHTVKHHGGWTVAQVEGSGGSLEWTSPTGRRYRVDPERRVPVFTPSDEPAPF